MVMVLEKHDEIGEKNLFKIVCLFAKVLCPPRNFGGTQYI